MQKQEEIWHWPQWNNFNDQSRSGLEQENVKGYGNREVKPKKCMKQTSGTFKMTNRVEDDKEAYFYLRINLKQLTAQILEFMFVHKRSLAILMNK